jgi:hypothetical protein
MTPAEQTRDAAAKIAREQVDYWRDRYRNTKIDEPERHLCAAHCAEAEQIMDMIADMPLPADPPQRPAVDGLLDDLANALEPFGAIADRYPKMSDDYPLWAARMKNNERVSNQDFSQTNHNPVVKVGDLRRARGTLERYNAAKKEPS